MNSVRTWGGTSSELVEAIAVAADGSVYVAGTTFSFGAGNNDIFVIKYDAGGALAWQRTWGQPNEFFGDSAGDVAVAADGSVYVVGTAVTTSNDVVLLKFAADGTLLWQRTWGGPFSPDLGNAVVVGPDGGIYVAGSTESFTDREVFIVKFSAEGAVVWEQTWSRGESDSAQALAVDAQGNVYVAGTSFRPGFIFDAVLLKFSPGGTLLAQAGYAVGEIADALGLAVAPDRSIYLVGSLDGAASGFIVRFRPQLTLDWQRTIGGQSGDRANAVTVAPDGSVWVVGETNTIEASDEAFVAQFSPRGRFLQAHTWGGSAIEHGIDVGFAPDGDLIVGAIAQAPPWEFRDSQLRVARLRGSRLALDGVVTTVAGTLGIPAGVVTVPEGSETFAGEADAAVLKITP